MTRKQDLEVNKDNPDSIFLYGHEFLLEPHSKKNMRTWYKLFTKHQVLVIIDEIETTKYPQASNAQEAEDLLAIFLFEDRPERPLERSYRCTASCNGNVFIENEADTPHEAWTGCKLSAYLEAIEIVQIDLEATKISTVAQELT
ncbi:MAG: hypothetical protein ILNGONEN_01413 [Syntrophorhabdaceae bacterium]|jgi:hypothetical protein|nr:hypothetical protein [Syntrophorhabdaceae bacterium]